MARALKLGRGIKDANAIENWTVNWATWLDSGVTISTSAWAIVQQELDANGLEQTLPASDTTPLTQDSISNTTTKATIKLSSGTPGTIYRVRNRITTSDSQTQDASFEIEIVQK